MPELIQSLKVNGIRKTIEELGWYSLDDSLWQKLEETPPQIVFLTPPLDTIPSPNGNAIYTIVPELAERSPVPCLVLSIWPPNGNPGRCSISDHILYCKKPFRPVFLEKGIPYRIKKFVWGTGRPEILLYAKQAAIICKLLGVKKVIVEDVPRFGLTIKNILGENAEVYLHQHALAPLSYSRIWWKKIQKAFSGIIFVAKKTLQDTEYKHGISNNSIVIYNGVDLDRYSPIKWKEDAENLRKGHAIHPDDLVVLYVGRIVPGKGCKQLAEAFIKASVPAAKLVVIGKLEDTIFSKMGFSTSLKELAGKHPGRIILTDSIPQDLVPGWYQAADLVVVPSMQSEGLPKVITEALAMGKPVLATDRGGSFELIKPGQNGWLLEDPHDIDQFAETLRNILQDRKKLVTLGNNALIFDRPNLDIDQSAANFFRFVLNDPDNHSVAANGQ